jgi:hypothetical protein
MSIDAKQKDLVHKLLGMLGSDFDGERAVAAKKISDIAKANKLSISDMMRFCYASASSQYRQPPPPPPPPPPPRGAKKEPWNTSDDDGVLDELKELIGEYGVEPLSAWEANFTRDICDRDPMYLSDKQIAVIARIISKLKKCATGAF